MTQLIEKYYIDGRKSCSESVFLAAGEKYGLNINAQTLKAMGAFSGGAFSGSMCGAAAGACAAIALKCGGDGLSAHDNPEMQEKCIAFMKEFTAAVGSDVCRDIKPKYFKQEVRCLPVPLLAAEILEKYMA